MVPSRRSPYKFRSQKYTRDCSTNLDFRAIFWPLLEPRRILRVIRGEGEAERGRVSEERITASAASP